ncbi:MAG TPA: ABC-three component system middle component 8 [Thermoanaerobaculia bacterium]|nr:ABC-three component system middle component 8 [Thermoanaerobaculia bacterium]
MIRAHKYLDLATCVVSVAAHILELLLVNRAMDVRELWEVLEVRLGDRARFNVLDALNLLFLLGKVDYDATADVLFLREAR